MEDQSPSSSSSSAVVVAAVESNNGKRKRGGKGKRKVEMKKIENGRSLMVTFSKRRQGLFKKAAELTSAVPGVSVAAVAFSPAGKPYTFGDLDRLIPLLHLHSQHHDSRQHQQHEVEKETSTSASTSSSSSSSGAVTGKGGGGLRRWWDVPIDGMGVDELQCLLEDMQSFKRLLIDLPQDLAWADSCLSPS